MQPPYVVPDTVEPVRGWRAWRMYKAGLLGSLTRSCVWPPHQAMEALCIPNSLSQEIGHIPEEKCTCGLYSLKRADQQLHVYTLDDRWYRLYSFGVSAFWGKVIEHKGGYRAQFGYPELIVVPSPIESPYPTPDDEPYISHFNKPTYYYEYGDRYRRGRSFGLEQPIWQLGHIAARDLALSYQVPTILINEDKCSYTLIQEIAQYIDLLLHASNYNYVQLLERWQHQADTTIILPHSSAWAKDPDPTVRYLTDGHTIYKTKHPPFRIY